MSDQHLLDSWDRQAKIIRDLAEKVHPSLLQVKPSEDGMSILEQFCHIHNTRKFWMSRFSPGHLEGVGKSYQQIGDEWVPLDDFEEVKLLLDQSAAMVRNAVGEALANGAGQLGNYENPVLYLQHMVWHEGWHAGLVMLALRLAGQEPSEDWEDQHLWQPWRGVEQW